MLCSTEDRVSEAIVISQVDADGKKAEQKIDDQEEVKKVGRRAVKLVMLKIDSSEVTSQVKGDIVISQFRSVIGEKDEVKVYRDLECCPERRSTKSLDIECSHK